MTAHHPPILYGVFFLSLRAFFWIDYRIIEFIGHLSNCKKRDIYDGDSEKKMGHAFFFSSGGTRKNKITKKRERKKW